MQGKVWTKVILATGALAGAVLIHTGPARAQGTEQTPAQQLDLATMGALIQ